METTILLKGIYWCYMGIMEKRVAQSRILGFPKIRSYLSGGPHNKSYSILGSILGFPYFGKVSYWESSLFSQRTGP